jgi:sugar phosphate isomerase/epimerase
MKILIHNHAGEFDLLENGKKTQYDILLAETDPALVALQIDIGWGCMAGLKNADPSTPPGRRRGTFIPIGQGELDYRTLFAGARVAGLKYFVIEQDNAGQNGGDALAGARANYQGMVKVLS